jgi:hypothetical protein
MRVGDPDEDESPATDLLPYADDRPTRYMAEPLPTLRPRCWWCESRLPHMWHDNGEANDGGLQSPRGGER